MVVGGIEFRAADGMASGSQSLWGECFMKQDTRWALESTRLVKRWRQDRKFG